MRAPLSAITMGLALALCLAASPAPCASLVCTGQGVVCTVTDATFGARRVACGDGQGDAAVVWVCEDEGVWRCTPEGADSPAADAGLLGTHAELCDAACGPCEGGWKAAAGE